MIPLPPLHTRLPSSIMQVSSLRPVITSNELNYLYRVQVVRAQFFSLVATPRQGRKPLSAFKNKCNPETEFLPSHLPQLFECDSSNKLHYQQATLSTRVKSTSILVVSLLFSSVILVVRSIPLRSYYK